MSGKYHHGNLRSALIEEAIKLTKHGNEQEISLRALAERLGVSRTAPYRHFRNKNALMGAVAARGFAMMRELFREYEPSMNAERAIRNVMEDYVKFATSNPLLYRLMFSRMILESDGSKELQREINYTMDALSEYFIATEPGITTTAEVKMASWAMVHGISSLLNENLVGLDDSGVVGHSLIQRGRAPSSLQLQKYIASAIHILAAGVTVCSRTNRSTDDDPPQL